MSAPAFRRKQAEISHNPCKTPFCRPGRQMGDKCKNYAKPGRQHVVVTAATQRREIRKEIIDKDKISVEFGTFIRDARERNGLYQADVAETVGVSRSHYAFIAFGKREIYFILVSTYIF